MAVFGCEMTVNSLLLLELDVDSSWIKSLGVF